MWFGKPVRRSDGGPGWPLVIVFWGLTVPVVNGWVAVERLPILLLGGFAALGLLVVLTAPLWVGIARRRAGARERASADRLGPAWLGQPIGLPNQSPIVRDLIEAAEGSSAAAEALLGQALGRGAGRRGVLVGFGLGLAALLGGCVWAWHAPPPWDAFVLLGAVWGFAGCLWLDHELTARRSRRDGRAAASWLASEATRAGLVDEVRAALLGLAATEAEHLERDGVRVLRDLLRDFDATVDTLTAGGPVADRPAGTRIPAAPSDNNDVIQLRRPS